MFDKNRNILNKLFGFLFIFCIFIITFSPTMSREANAQLFVPVWDPANLSANAVTASNATNLSVKEYILDAVIYKVLDLVIQKMTASTVEWINSGFKGRPAFITNQRAYFQELGDGIAGDFIFNNPNLNFLCGPISARIKIALASNYRGGDINWQCTLNDALGNMEDFMNDFDKGGWDQFFLLTQDSQNNPIGAYIQAEGELARQIAKKTDETNKELSWGKGFFSAKKCERYGPDILDEVTGETLKGACIKEGIETPGSVIEGQLGEVLSIGGKRLAVADEINEMISALLNQLVGRVIGGVGGGLRSISQKDPTNESGQAFSELLHSTANDSIIDNYIESSATNLQQTIQNSIDNPYNPYACRDNPNLPECQVPQGGTTIDDNVRTTACNPAVETCESTTVSGSRSR